MNRSEAFAALEPGKRAIAGRVLGALAEIEGLESLTFVGSFVDADDCSGISDIDAVAVFDSLLPERFAGAIAAVSALTGDDVGCPGKRLLVNATFGPLKFDASDQLVIHLMLYDRASHRDHVLKSPFTCYDWERSPHHWGRTLRDLFPVGALQPGDFLSARRGLENYIRDLESGTLSFRRLKAHDGALVEVSDAVALDARHTGEYAYHIIRNLIANALKMRTGRNDLRDSRALVADWQREIEELTNWIPFYQTLRQAKLLRNGGFPNDTLPKTRAFLKDFAMWLDHAYGRMHRVTLVRHARTALNDGSFLGRGRDPGIADTPQACSGPFDAIYSSPMRRAVETARTLAASDAIRTDPRLLEIDYGLAEGLTAAQARDGFPSLREAWDQGRDVPFPGGEGTVDVRTRARAFLDSLPDGPGRTLVVTHNVVIRTIIADLLGLDLSKAYRLPVEHLEPLEICRAGGRWIPNFSLAARTRLLDGYTEFPPRA